MLKAYTAYSKDPVIRKQSSSGGIFYPLAKYIINQGGIVFGAAWTKDWHVEMKPAETLEDIKAFMGSKYVKAHPGNTFSECKNYLEEGKPVLYTGTPCQITAIKAFLGKEYSNLFTISIACEGMMPTSKWDDYLTKKSKAGCTITSINMRSKEGTTWDDYNLVISYSDGTVFKENHKNNEFLKTFVAGHHFNSACYDCIAKKNFRADLIIGDWWCINKYCIIDDKDGVSFILSNSNKGEELLEHISSDIYLLPTNIEIIKKHNAGIISHSPFKPVVEQKTNMSIEKEEIIGSPNSTKKHVGIVTMNLHFNIGTALQAYALQKVIINAGYDCDVITWKRADRVSFCDKYIKMRVLDSAKDYNKIKESDYDIFVVGSDQIWKRETSLKDYKEKYIDYPFLKFTDGWTKVRFSYAASLGRGGNNWQYNSVEDKKLASILSNFNAISLRETQSCLDFKEHLKLEATQNIDPTLLLEKRDYLAICEKVMKKQSGVLAYLLDPTAEKKAYVNEVRYARNLPIMSYIKGNVADLLACFRDAEIVITDSYHGVLFAIIFNKPFIYWNNRDDGNIRFDTIEQLFNISNRCITNNFELTTEIMTSPNIDLQKYKNIAISYIEENLKAESVKMITTDYASINHELIKNDSKNAWMLFLSSDNYVYYVLNTFKSLVDSGTRYPTYCGCTENVSQKTLDILEKCGIKTFLLLDDDSSLLGIKLHNITNWQKAFPKLLLWKNQLKLDKMVYLDSDLYIYKNIDELFAAEHLSAVTDGAPCPQRGHGPYKLGDSVFCSGLIVWDFTKDDGRKIFKALKQLGPNVQWHDQNVLNYVYSDWINQPELHLSYTYGLMTTKTKFNFVESNNMASPKVIHFIAGQGNKTKMPFTTEIFNLCGWDDLPVVYDYYSNMHDNIEVFKHLYNFDLAEINLKNINIPSSGYTCAHYTTNKAKRTSQWYGV